MKLVEKKRSVESAVPRAETGTLELERLPKYLDCINQGIIIKLYYYTEDWSTLTKT